jgi:hypothetical protein
MQVQNGPSLVSRRVRGAKSAAFLHVIAHIEYSTYATKLPYAVALVRDVHSRIVCAEGYSYGIIVCARA